MTDTERAIDALLLRYRSFADPADAALARRLASGQLLTWPCVGCGEPLRDDDGRLYCYGCEEEE